MIAIMTCSRRVSIPSESGGGVGAPLRIGERGSAPKRGGHSSIYFFSPNASVQWQPDVLTIHTKKWSQIPRSTSHFSYHAQTRGSGNTRKKAYHCGFRMFGCFAGLSLSLSLSLYIYIYILCIFVIIHIICYLYV